MKNDLLRDFEKGFGIKVKRYEDKEYRIGSADYYSIGVGFYTQGGGTFRGVYEVDIEGALPVIIRHQLQNGMLGSGYYRNYLKMMRYTQYYNDLTFGSEEHLDSETEEKMKEVYFDKFPESMLKSLLEIEIKKGWFDWYSFASTVQKCEYSLILGNNFDLLYDEERNAYMYVFEVY